MAICECLSCGRIRWCVCVTSIIANLFSAVQFVSLPFDFIVLRFLCASTGRSERYHREILSFPFGFYAVPFFGRPFALSSKTRGDRAKEKVLRFHNFNCFSFSILFMAYRNDRGRDRFVWSRQNAKTNEWKKKNKQQSKHVKDVKQTMDHIARELWTNAKRDEKTRNER